MLDQTVERNKNLRDAYIVENWIRKSHEILGKCELDPLPDSFLHETVPSETGTDYSAAMTSEHVPHDQVLSAACVSTCSTCETLHGHDVFAVFLVFTRARCVLHSSLPRPKTKFHHRNHHLGV
jgi:hypothetical protein